MGRGLLFGALLLVAIIAALCVAARRRRRDPERLYIVEAGDFGVSCRAPDGTVETVSWNRLTRVELLTNDHGPALSDVFWYLEDSNGGCTIPLRATGGKELLSKILKLPGFRHGPFREAMCSTTNARFVCWEQGS
jgi:hypothetical protein